MAWKRIDYCGSEDNPPEEVRTLISRHHEHLVPLLACYSTPEGQSHLSLDRAHHLIFPWTDTDMSNWMNPDVPYPPKHPAGLQDSCFRKEHLYMTIISLSSAISHLHREIDGHFTPHNDLKPENILLFGQKWKICDFGKTRLRSLDENLETEDNLGSFVYRPPEYEDGSVKKHGRSFDMWSLGCIVVELAVLIVYGWKGEQLRAFEADRIKNGRQQNASSKESDASFHNNMPVVRRWMRKLTRKDGSRNFIYLMKTASRMLSADPNARPYSWEVESCLYEQLRPNEPGDERFAKMRALVQAPEKSCTHNPLAWAIADGNWGFEQCLRQKGWTLSSSSSSCRSMVDPENMSGDAVSLLETYMPPSSEIGKLFKRTYEARGYESDKMANKGRRNALAQKFAETIASARITFWEIKHILELRYPFDLMEILAGYLDLNQSDGDQYTALFWASLIGEVRAVDILLRYGAEVNPTNKLSETPLVVASKLGHTAVVGRLLDEPTININHFDDQRRTALSYAEQAGWTKVVHLLLDKGANSKIPGVPEEEEEEVSDIGRPT